MEGVRKPKPGSKRVYRSMGIVAGTNQVVLGHRSNGNWYVDAVASTTILAGTDYTLLVALTDVTTNTVNVVLNGKSVLSFSYNFLVHDGGVGLFARNGNASFDNVLIRGDDIAYAGGGTPEIAAAQPSQPVVGAPLTADALAPIVTAAKELWVKALGAGDPRLAILDQVTVLVSDLPNQLLGATTGTTVVLDSNAAGWGWFVDPTPQDNSEFPIVLSSGVYAATPGSPAYGHMDLLTTLVHEFGNAMGFAEDQGQDVAGATLQAGVRRIPTVAASPAFTADPSIAAPVGSNSSLSNGFVPAFAGDLRFTQPALNPTNGSGVPGSANAVGLAPAVPSNPQIASLIANAPVVSGLSGATPVASTTLTGQSFVTPVSALTADLGGNLSGPSAIPPFVAATEPSPVENHSRLLNTSGARPDAGEATVIDWGSEGVGTFNQLGSSDESRDWLDDFLNHVGQNPTQRNPNAGISVRPTAAGVHAQI